MTPAFETLAPEPPLERKLPGFASTSHYPTGPWEAFEPDPDWSESALWVRLIFGGRFAQFTGLLSGSPPPGEGSLSWIGNLEPGFRPLRPLRFVVGGRRSGTPNLAILADGSVILFEPSLLPESFSIHVVYSLAFQLSPTAPEVTVSG